MDRRGNNPRQEARQELLGGERPPRRASRWKSLGLIQPGRRLKGADAVEIAPVDPPTYHGPSKATKESATLVKACQAQYEELELAGEDARSFRESASSVREAAIKAMAALDMALLSEKRVEPHLSKLSAEIRALLTRGTMLVRKYGDTPRIVRHMRTGAKKRSLSARFMKVAHQLELMAEEAWQLREKGEAYVSPSRKEAQGQGLGVPTVSGRSRRAPGDMGFKLVKKRIRKGKLMESQITAVLYIEECMSAGGVQARDTQGILWWSRGGKLFRHDLGTDATSEISAERIGSTVMCMSSDRNGRIWTGHVKGILNVWTNNGEILLASNQCQSSSIRAISIDEWGVAWVGWANGIVRRLEIRGREGFFQLEVLGVLTPTGRETPCGTPAKDSTGARGIHRVFSMNAESRAHQGRVRCIFPKNGKVYTSGGSSRSCSSIKVWDDTGEALGSRHCSHYGLCDTMAAMNWEVKKRTSAIDDDWRLISGHDSGDIVLWDPTSLLPMVKVGQSKSPIRNIFVNDPLGMVFVSHQDGLVGFWSMLRPDPNTPGMNTGNTTQYHALYKHLPRQGGFKAHQGKIAHAVGGTESMVTASRFGTVSFWPEAFLQEEARKAGFSPPTVPGPLRKRATQIWVKRVSKVDTLHRFNTLKNLNVPADPELSAPPRLPGNDNPPESPDNPKPGSAIRTPPAEPLHAKPIPPPQTSAAAPPKRAVEDVKERPREDFRREAKLDDGLTTDDRTVTVDAAWIRTDVGSEARLGTIQELPSTILSSGQSLRPVGEELSSPVSTAGGPQGSMQGSFEGFRSLSKAGHRLSLGREASIVIDPLPPEHSILLSRHDLSWDKADAETLGDGAFGTVYRGKAFMTDVAIKVLKVNNLLGGASTLKVWEEDHDSHDRAEAALAKALHMLQREAQVMYYLRHPNIVMFMGVCLDPPSLVTEYCAKGSLFDLLQRVREGNEAMGKQLTWRRLMKMALEAAMGVYYLHRQDIEHRDLKSPNLLVDAFWKVKVSDFGTSKLLSPQIHASSVHASNPRWLAPEALRDNVYGFKADVYSFGIILWELLSWQQPWEECPRSCHAVTIYNWVLEGQRPEVPPNSKLPAGPCPVYDDWTSLIYRCWDQDPNNRPDFSFLVKQLEEMLRKVVKTEVSLIKSEEGAFHARGAQWNAMVPPPIVVDSGYPSSNMTGRISGSPREYTRHPRAPSPRPPPQSPFVPPGSRSPSPQPGTPTTGYTQNESPRMDNPFMMAAMKGGPPASFLTPPPGMPTPSEGSSELIQGVVPTDGSNHEQESLDNMPSASPFTAGPFGAATNGEQRGFPPYRDDPLSSQDPPSEASPQGRPSDSASSSARRLGSATGSTSSGAAPPLDSQESPGGLVLVHSTGREGSRGRGHVGKKATELREIAVYMNGLMADDVEGATLARRISEKALDIGAKESWESSENQSLMEQLRQAIDSHKGKDQVVSLWENYLRASPALRDA